MAKWPDHLEDVKAGMRWILDHGHDHDPRRKQNVEDHEGSKGYILAGHSVGGTMTLKICQAPALPFVYPAAAISLCGIYDFTALRDAHAHSENRKIYDDFSNTAFGPEQDGGWVRGNTTQDAIRREIRLVVLAHSKTDSLVEWQQTDLMSDVFRRLEPDQQGVVMEIYGDHMEIYEKGTEIARSVRETVRRLGDLRG